MKQEWEESKDKTSQYQDYKIPGSQQAPSSSKSEQHEDMNAKYFGLQYEQPIINIEFILKGNKRYSIPYALSPDFEFNPDGEAYVAVHTLRHHVIIKGRGLINLYKYLIENKVKWVKQSSASTDDEAEKVFISEISYAHKKF